MLSFKVRTVTWLPKAIKATKKENTNKHTHLVREKKDTLKAQMVPTRKSTVWQFGTFYFREFSSASFTDMEFAEAYKSYW